VGAGLFLQPHGTSPLNREVGRFLLHPLSWERGPMPCYWREMLSCVRWCGAGRGTAPPKSRFIPSRLDARGPCKQSIHAFHNQNILMIRNCPNARVSLSTSTLSNGHFGLKVYSGRFILPCSLSISLSNSRSLQFGSFRAFIVIFSSMSQMVWSAGVPRFSYFSWPCSTAIERARA